MVKLPRIFSASSQISESVEENESRVSKIYNLERFEESQYSVIKRKLKSQKKHIQNKMRDSETYKNYLYKRIPVLEWLPKYQESYIVPDLIAGITIGVMNIPQVF